MGLPITDPGKVDRRVGPCCIKTTCKSLRFAIERVGS